MIFQLLTVLFLKHAKEYHEEQLMEEKKNDEREYDYILNETLVSKIREGIEEVNDDGKTNKIKEILKTENLGKYYSIVNKNENLNK